MSMIAIAYFALAFALSWGGVLFVIGGPDAIPVSSAENSAIAYALPVFRVVMVWLYD